MMVSLSHLMAGFLLTAGKKSAMRYKHLWSSVTVYNARSTKHGLTLYSHGHPWIVCMTAKCDVLPKTTEQNQIVCTEKSKAEVTNNKRLCLIFYTPESNYWQTRSIVWPLTTDRHEASHSLSVTQSYLFHTPHEFDDVVNFNSFD